MDGLKGLAVGMARAKDTRVSIPGSLWSPLWDCSALILVHSQPIISTALVIISDKQLTNNERQLVTSTACSRVCQVRQITQHIHMAFRNQNPPKTRHKFSNDADVTFLHTSIYFPTNINCGENPKPLGCITYSTDRAAFAQLKITYIYIGV